MSSEHTTHFVFDTETLATDVNAAILSIGVAAFKFEEPTTFKETVKKGLYLKLDIQEQVEKYDRTIDPATVKWWKSEGPDAKEVLKPSKNDLDIKTALEFLTRFLRESGYENGNSWLWSRGNRFDFGKLETLFTNIGRQEPWNGKMERDVRGYFDMMTGCKNGYADPLGDRSDFIKHNSLHDAANDAVTMVEYYQQSVNEGSE